MNTDSSRKNHLMKVEALKKEITIGDYCSSRAWGGLEMNVLRHLRWMKQRGWNIILYAPPASALFKEARKREIAVRPIAQKLKYGDIVNAWRLARQARKDNVRILMLHQSPDIFLSVFAKLFSGNFFKLIYSQHMHIGNKKDFFHALEYRQFDAWITPTRWLADRVQEKTVVPPEKIFVTVRGIEVEQFAKNLPNKMSARHKLGLPEDIVLAGIIGRLDPQKCQDTAVKALKKVHEAGHKIHLAIVGSKTLNEETGYAEYIYKLTDDLGLKDYIHFVPHQKQQEYAFAALDMFILTSSSETYGMVVIEAMASALPVIRTKSGGAVDQIRDGETGFLFTPRNENELAEAMLKLLENPQLAAEIGQKARQDTCERYSHTRQCEEWEMVIRKTLV